MTQEIVPSKDNVNFIDEIKNIIKKMEPHERVDFLSAIFDGYCIECGNEHPRRTTTPEKIVAASIHLKSNKMISDALSRGDLDVPHLLVNNRVPEKRQDHEPVEEFLARGVKS